MVSTTATTWTAVSDYLKPPVTSKKADALRKLITEAPRFIATIAPVHPARNVQMRSDPGPQAIRSDLFLSGEDTVAHRVEGLLPDAGSMLIGAKKKVGKSLFLINLARQIARGEPFLGRESSHLKDTYAL
jgi:RecA-family ATPase